MTIKEARQNDTLLSMASSFCVGLGIGISTLTFFVQAPWIWAPLGATLVLFTLAVWLLGRAEDVRTARWQR